MLGRTHVVSSLAVLHAGLVGYTAYKVSDVDTEILKDVTVFGFALGNPVHVLNYISVIITVLFLVLILLRIGSGKMRLLFLILGGLLSAGVFILNDAPYSFELLLISLLFGLGSLFPDIDTPTSTIGKYFPFVGSIIGHRTVTHTIWALLLLSAATWYFDSVLLLAFTAGYTLHIIQDSFSRQGIAWFYPVLGGYNTFGSGAVMKQGRKPGPLAYHTGGTGEEIAFYVSIFIHVLCLGIVLYTTFY